MKTAGILLSFILCASQTQGGSVASGHIPIPHGHPGGEPPYDYAPYNSICWGYAQGRAFGKDSGDPDCDPDETYAMKIYTSHFEFKSWTQNFQNIARGDIIVFGSGVLSDLNGHAALVTSVPSNLSGQNIGDIIVDQVPNENAEPQIGIRLSTVISIQGPAGRLP
ncbi:MAG: hypothetical protein L0287_33135 [Anaerolineae bacterium]|nr:hypothetical protein [Anaerolineae bacterium]